MAGIAAPIALITLASLATCCPPRRMPPPPPACDADKLAPLVGTRGGVPVEKEARRLTGAREVRWDTPGIIFTQDRRPQRLNIVVDKDDVIQGAWCG